MKPNSHAEMHEGQGALERFRKAMTIVVSVPKAAIVQARKKTPAKRKPPTKKS